MVVSMERWIGKVAVVTGASSGIGASIVDGLVEHGLKVVGIARRVELVEEKSKKLSNKKGKLYAVKADVSKEEDILKAFDWVTKNVGPISILINNAGTIRPRSELTTGKTEDWKTVLDLNVLGLCIATREALKIMKANNINNGHIVHISSVTAHVVPNFPGTNVYPASKHAVKALTETLRQELVRMGSKTKVTEVSPGLVVSELTTLNKNLPAENVAAMSKMPILQGEDIADAVIYALSTPEHVQVHEMIVKPVGEMF